MVPFKHQNPGLMLRRVRESRFLKECWWDLRSRLGLKTANTTELLYRVGQRLAQNRDNICEIPPTGYVEYLSKGSVLPQFRSIFLERCYAFTSHVPDPVIIDCGGNIGLSAIWFKQNYPSCNLTVYEADPDLALLLRRNLARAGIDAVTVRSEAVWVEEGLVAFEQTRDDRGAIRDDAKSRVRAIDLARNLPERVDLLKLDIEGAEFAVLERLYETKALQRVEHLIAEFHVRRRDTDRFIRSLQQLRESGMEIAFRADVMPWIGLADMSAPFESIARNRMLVEVHAWRTSALQQGTVHS
jgi:FkbM family methyltransferase